MRPEKLVGLEALRGFAALYVFVHHLRLTSNAGWGMAFYFGQEAVILFFLLSGFVIDHSTRSRAPSVRRYGVHRIRRIYPIFLFALLLAYLSACVHAGSLLPADGRTLLGNLLMLQDVGALKPGVWFDTYYGNTALWSLSYEWWFYMAFIPLSLIANPPAKSRFPLVVMLSMLGTMSYLLLPNQASLFLGYLLIWWAGVELSRIYSATGGIPARVALTLIVALVSIALLWSIALFFTSGSTLRFGTSPILQIRHFLAAAAFIAIAYAWSTVRFSGFLLLFRPFAVLAPVSYFLYACHLPIIQIARDLHLFDVPWQGALLSLAATLALGWIFEVRLQRWINKALA